MSAWVSPPQPSVSHIVATAPSMAQAASTALPPLLEDHGAGRGAERLAGDGDPVPPVQHGFDGALGLQGDAGGGDDEQGDGQGQAHGAGTSEGQMWLHSTTAARLRGARLQPDVEEPDLAPAEPPEASSFAQFDMPEKLLGLRVRRFSVFCVGMLNSLRRKTPGRLPRQGTGWQILTAC